MVLWKVAIIEQNLSKQSQENSEMKPDSSDAALSFKISASTTTGNFATYAGDMLHAGNEKNVNDGNVPKRAQDVDPSNGQHTFIRCSN